MRLLSKSLWLDTLDRALNTFIQVFAGFYVVDGVLVDPSTVDLALVAQVAGLAALISVVKSVISAQFGKDVNVISKYVRHAKVDEDLKEMLREAQAREARVNPPGGDRDPA